MVGWHLRDGRCVHHALVSSFAHLPICAHPFPSHLPSPVHLSTRHDTPRTDHIIRVTRKQRLAVRAPRQTHTFRLAALLAYGRILWLQLVDFALLFEIEDDDGAACCGAQPVAVGGEDERVDLVAGGEGVEVFRLV